MSYWQNIYHYDDIDTTPNESLLTIGTSLARVATKLLTTSYTTCQIRTLDKLLQVFTYHHKDQFRVIFIKTTYYYYILILHILLGILNSI